MLFNSYEFIFLFLPLCLAVWWHPRLTEFHRLTFLVAASYVFYGWWDYRFVTLLLLSTVVDYQVGKLLYITTNECRRTLLLLVSLVGNLGLLGFFKYSGFLASSLNAVMAGLSGARPLPVWQIVLPVGISFYTFQTLSYTIDIYRRQAVPARSLLQFAAYVSFFPQLIAGPIVRYSQLHEQLQRLALRPDWSQMAQGLFFFVAGLSQKLLLADLIAARVNPLLADHHSLQLFGSWLAMLGYTCQLYFDFAGYSNMAVGLGLLMGLSLPQNFASPYQSHNITEFWRRWHITLSTWLRDYLFIPLGGNRFGLRITLRNLMLVMLLGGIWHGAGWTFVLWGLYHGTLLVLHRSGRQRLPDWIPQPLAVAATFLAIVWGWVLFRAVDVAMACRLWAAMLGRYGWEAGWMRDAGNQFSLAILAVLLGIVFVAPNVWQLPFRPTRRWALGLALLWVLCVLRLDSESPFLYFQF